MVQMVSITFQNTDDARPIIEAIEADNPDAVVAHYPAMVKIDCPGRLVVKRESVEERLGRDWDVQEIHLSLISLAGEIDEDDDHFILEWKTA